MNDHILEYCLDYIYSDLKPEFAILIKGEWGSGKTYLIEQIKSKLNNELIKDSEIISLSLFGVNSIDELDEKIYQSLHPVLSSPQFKFASNLIRSAIKVGTNVDINGDGKKDISLSFGGIPTKKKFSESQLKKKLLIIDDLERTKLNPSIIFGYFSEMIISHGLKTIIIGNDSQIDCKNIEKDYKLIKEKIVGIEFTLEPNIEDAIQSFIDEIELNDYKKEIQEICIQVLNILEYKNLRNLRQAFYNFKILIDLLPDEIEPHYLQKSFRIFLGLFLQNKKNEINENTIKDAILAIEEHGISYKKFKENQEKKEFTFSYYNSLIPLASCWKGIIFHGEYTKETILENFNKDITPIKEETEENPLISLMSNWSDLKTDDFRTLYTTVIELFNKGEYLTPHAILHYVNIMLCFINWKIIDQHRDKFLADTISTIEKYKFQIEPIDRFNYFDLTYGGFGLSEGNDGLNQVRDKLIEFNETNFMNKKRTTLNNDIMNLKSNLEEFTKKILHVGGNGFYRNIPVFSLIDIESFSKIFLGLSHFQQLLLIESFEERYGIVYGNKPFDPIYKPDLENIKKFKDILEENIGEKLYNPQAINLSRNIDRIEKLIEYIGSFI